MRSLLKPLVKPLLVPYERLMGGWLRHRSIARAIREAELAAEEATRSGPQVIDTIRQVWPGEQDVATARRIAIFAHFDERSEISPAAQAYIRDLAKAGLCVIFVSTSPDLNEHYRRLLGPHVGAMMLRQNFGHDFGSWRDGLTLIENPATRDAILLANDSVFGPLRDLGGVLEQFDDRADVWGLTESFEISRHLQSYFLYFRSTALRSKAFEEFWSTFQLSGSRFWAVRHGEIGLSRFLRKRGLRLRAIAGYRDVRRTFRLKNRRLGVRESRPLLGQPRNRAETAFLLNDGHSVNPTHYFWRELVDEYGLPFLKRDLVMKNPELIGDAAEARQRAEAWLAGLQ